METTFFYVIVVFGIVLCGYVIFAIRTERFSISNMTSIVGVMAIVVWFMSSYTRFETEVLNEIKADSLLSLKNQIKISGRVLSVKELSIPMRQEGFFSDSYSSWKVKEIVLQSAEKLNTDKLVKAGNKWVRVDGPDKDQVVIIDFCNTNYLTGDSITLSVSQPLEDMIPYSTIFESTIAPERYKPDQDGTLKTDLIYAGCRKEKGK